MSTPTVTFQLKGADELIKALQELPVSVEKKVMTAGLSKGAARLRTYIRRAAPRISGELIKSIGIKRIKGRQLKYKVGLLRNQYYRTLDIGRKPYQRNGHPVAGTPKLKSEGIGIERAWMVHREEIANLIIEEAKKALAKEVGRLFVKGRL
jgi:hypothetical protein